jgi:outer membrane protein assembly factor BamB/predicted phosphodiesterase
MNETTSCTRTITMTRKILLLVFFIGSQLGAQQPTFRFAWLTDTHVGSPTGEEDLRRSVRDINRINQLSGISFVIHSGDVTEMGQTRELLLAKSILDSLHMPLYIIPGNHDTKWSESGCSMFRRIWKDDKFVFDFGGVRFIACSSGPNMRQGDGHVPEEDIRWLDSVLTHMEKKDQPVVFINHYPLDDGLDNWYDVTDRIKQVNTIAVLCGHGHANKPMEFEGLPAVMGRSNLRAQKTSGGYTLVDVRSDSLIFSERTPSAAAGAEPQVAAGAARQWHAIANITHRYSADTATYRRPDYSVNEKYAFVHERWKAATGFTIGSSPAVAGDAFVIVGNNKGAIEGYSIFTGKKLWSYQTEGSVYSTAAVAVRHSTGDLRAIVGSSDGAIYCIDPANGKLVWKSMAQGPVVASPLIAGGVAYCGSSDGVFRALSVATGKSLWEYSGVAGFVESTPLLYENTIIFGAWDTFLYALDRATGTLRWKWSNEKSTRNLSPAACTPVAAAGKVFIVAPDRFMTALDIGTGHAVWRTNAHEVRETIGLSADTMTVYVRTMNDSLIALSTTASEPRVLWSLDCKYGYDFAPSMPLEKDGSVFFGTKNGLVYCVNAQTHAVTWIHKVGNTVINTVKPLSSTDVIVTSMDGSVVFLSGA